jgi:hypothetical protein
LSLLLFPSTQPTLLHIPAHDQHITGLVGVQRRHIL